MKYLEIEVDDGTGDNAPYELPLTSSHTVVRVNFIGSLDTEVFLQLPDGAEVGDTFEFFTLNNIGIGVYYPPGDSIFGTAMGKAYRGVLTLKKVRQGDGVNYESVWLGSYSIPHSLM